MAGDDNSDSSAGWLANLNIPHVLLGPAGAALSRLIGKATDIPAAKLDQRAQKIKDDTAAQSIVTKALAQAAAKQAVKDPAIMERAMDAFVSQQFRKQENRDAVAHRAIELLAEGPPPSGSDKPAEPDPDWMNIFERHAEDASSEKMRDVWARVLAGEIRKPRSISLRTLNFVAQLDQQIARLFEQYAARVVDGDIIPTKSGARGQEFVEVIKLQEYGLIAARDVSKSYEIKIDGVDPQLRFPNGSIVLRLSREGEAKKFKLDINCALLSGVGQEILAIVNPPFKKADAMAVVNLLPKLQPIRDICIYDPKADQIVEVIWKREPPPINS